MKFNETKRLIAWFKQLWIRDKEVIKQITSIFWAQNIIEWLMQDNHICKVFLNQIWLEQNLSTSIKELIWNKNFVEMEDIFESLAQIVEKFFPSIEMEVYRYNKSWNALDLFVWKKRKYRIILSEQKKNYINEKEAIESWCFCFSQATAEDKEIWWYACLPINLPSDKSFLICFNAKENTDIQQINFEILKLKTIFQTLLIDIIIKEKLINLSRIYINDLTGLYNRKYLDLIGKKKNYSSIFIDINEFKRINDDLWHHIWDEILRELSKIIIESIRPQDKACRYWGDEIVILVDTDSQKILEQIKQRIIDKIKQRNEDKKYSYCVTIGMAVRDGRPTEELICQANRLLHETKPLDGTVYRIIKETIPWIQDKDVIEKIIEAAKEQLIQITEQQN